VEIQNRTSGSGYFTIFVAKREKRPPTLFYYTPVKTLGFFPTKYKYQKSVRKPWIKGPSTTKRETLINSGV